MCKISTRLKLCTCNTSDVQTLQHYWTLKRPLPSMVNVMGEIVAPADISKETALYNQETLKGMLNGGNCFDVDMKPRANDVVELHFSCQDSYLAYSFVSRNRKWEITKNDPFGNGLEEKQAGKIRHLSNWRELDERIGGMGV